MAYVNRDMARRKGPPRRTFLVNPAKVGEAFHLVIPSQAHSKRCLLWEGVETGWQAPGLRQDEGTVQPTNPKGAAKAVVGCITVWSQVRTLLGPLILVIFLVGNRITRARELEEKLRENRILIYNKILEPYCIYHRFLKSQSCISFQIGLPTN